MLLGANDVGGPSENTRRLDLMAALSGTNGPGLAAVVNKARERWLRGSRLAHPGGKIEE